MVIFKRFSWPGWVVLSCVLLVLACPAQAQEKILWRMGTLAPEDSVYSRQAQDVIFPKMKELTNGALGFRVFWGGVRGDDTVVLRKIKSGELQAAGLSGLGTVLACPDFAVLELPYLFQNLEEVDYIRNHMLPVFDGLMEKNGFKMLAWVDQGFDQIYSTQPDINTIRGLDSLYFLTWMGPMEARTLNALGVRMYDMGIMEIGAMVKDGIGDAMFAPPVWIKSNQLFSVFKFVNPIKMRYSPAAAVVDIKEWEKLTPASRNAITGAREAMSKRFIDSCRRDSEKQLASIIEFGVQKKELSPHELFKVKEKVKEVYESSAGVLYTKEILDEIQAHLDDFRVGKLTKPTAVPIVKTTTRPAAATPSGTATRAITAETIQMVQVKLQSLGYYNLRIDGIMGIKTLLGIKNYQKDNNLPATGVIDEQLLKSMGIK